MLAIDVDVGHQEAQRAVVQRLGGDLYNGVKMFEIWASFECNRFEGMQFGIVLNAFRLVNGGRMCLISSMI